VTASLDEKTDKAVEGGLRQPKKPRTVHCPKCGRGFTSRNRLLQSHYDEATSTCKQQLEADQKHHPCPSCGKLYFSRSSLLLHHYNESTGTCKQCDTSTSDANHTSTFSDSINLLLAADKISERELYAAISEVQCGSYNPKYFFIFYRTQHLQSGMQCGDVF